MKYELQGDGIFVDDAGTSQNVNYLFEQRKREDGFITAFVPSMPQLRGRAHGLIKADTQTLVSSRTTVGTALGLHFGSGGREVSLDLRRIKCSHAAVDSRN